MDEWILPLMLVVPVAGAVVCALAGGLGAGKAARGVAFLASCLGVVLAGVAAAKFNWGGLGGASGSGTQLETVMFGFVFEPIHFSAKLGVDALSLVLAGVTSLLGACAILAGDEPGSMKGGSSGVGAYYAWLMVLMAALTGVWLARDLLLFYTFFELMLVPLFFLIGTYGGAERKSAATKLFIYTFTGSILALPAILYVGFKAGTFDIAAAASYAQMNFTWWQRFWVLMGLLISFGIKTPLFPLHTWQPSAMSESPGNGVVDCVGLVLKLGAYAILKIAIPIGLLGPAGSIAMAHVQTVLGVLAVIGIVYGALCAWVQTDAKRLLAYSSLSHVGFVVLGIVAMNEIGVQGAALYLVNTAITTGALFLVVGMIYSRTGTRDMNELSGLGRRMPVMAFFMGLFTMAAIGLPLLNGFVSEFLTILGAFSSPYLGIGFGVVAASGIVLGAIYMLSMAGRLLFGAERAPSGFVREGKRDLPVDLSGREVGALLPLAVLVLVLGVYPTPLLRAFKSASGIVVGAGVVQKDSGLAVAAGDFRLAAEHRRDAPPARDTGGAIGTISEVK